MQPALLERDIRRLLDKREGQAGPRLNPSRAPVAARAFGRASPCMRSRRASGSRSTRSAKPLGGPPTPKAARNRGEHTCPEIGRVPSTRLPASARQQAESSMR